MTTHTEYYSNMSNIKVRIIADSFNPIAKVRLTTFEWEYPRFIHGEVMTHRMLSKNAASSRAVPMLKAIDNILENPAWPVHFGANQPGMMAHQELTGTDLQAAKSIWARAMHAALEYGRALADLHAHKQWAARIMEPFQMMKVVVSGTDWDNFLWLRYDEEAQPEFQELARLVKEALDFHEPELLEPGQWHTPYVDHVWVDDALTYFVDGSEVTLDVALKISASCCAQVSYRNLDQTKDKALEIYGKLFSGRKPHMSPTEHQGTPMRAAQKGVAGNGVTSINFVCENLYSGNFREWIQYRQTLPNNCYRE